jgi:hypothetical protein
MSHTASAIANTTAATVRPICSVLAPRNRNAASAARPSTLSTRGSSMYFQN